MPLTDNWKLKSEHKIASLWSGYGTITRRTYHAKDPSQTRNRIKTTILKQVSAPTPPSFNESHVRKMLSYNIERYFYQHLSSRISPRDAHLAHVHNCTVDAIEMEDLNTSYPVSAGGSLDVSRAKVVLRWLANFHAALWDAECPTVGPPSRDSLSDIVSREGIWEEGSYWYLRTRKDEFEDLSEEWKGLAVDVDVRIRAIPRELTTVVHGDCKAANIVFSASEEECALYDLQYVGRSPGVRDVVYFFISSVRGLDRHEEELLRFYYKQLSEALIRCGSGVGERYTWEVMLEHYELCMLDYYRFMLGWVCYLFFVPCG
jgi:hypothetical protein